MSDKKSKTSAADHGAVPEVEAEVVEEPSASPDPGEEKPDAGASPDDGEEKIEPVKPNTLTPGVFLFIAFVLLSIGALIAWRVYGVDDTSADDPPAIDAAPAVIDTSPPSASVLSEEEAAAVSAPVASAPEAPLTGDAPITDDSAGNADATALSLIEEDLAPLASADPVPAESMIDSADAASAMAAEASDETLAESPAAPAEGNEPAVSALEVETLRQALDDQRGRNDLMQHELEQMRLAINASNEAREDAARQIARLETALQQRRDENSPSAQRRAAGAAALIALEAAVKTGAPFAVEVETLARLTPSADGLGALRRHAATGAPGIEALKNDFALAARHGLAAAGQEQSDNGLARLVARVQSLISIRPAGPRAGNTPRAVISRAEAALTRGDVAAALTEIDALSPGMQAAMGGWLARARAAAETKAALAALNRYYFGSSEGGAE